jgi:hydrogenase-4 membrane subunit HyfE
MSEIAIRFFAGGLVVSAFAIISDLLKPKTFAGLFGAAPSVALASVVLTVCTKGKGVAATEARSMILGAIALLLYAALVSRLLLRWRSTALKISLASLLVWLAAAVGLWYLAGA